MTKTITNYVEVIGLFEDKEEFYRFVKSEDRLFDLNKIISLPKDERYNWSNYHNTHWGTKRNTWNCHLSKTSRRYRYWFDTADSPPDLIYFRLVDLFPSLQINWSYVEDGIVKQLKEPKYG